MPVNPCGYGLSELTTCYETDCRFPGFGVHRIRWYFTDLPYLNVPSVYCSKNWWRDDPSDLEWDDGSPGEVWTSPHKRTSGKPPAECCNDGPKGSPEAWMGLSGATFPTFEPCRWGAAYSHGYSEGYDSLTLAEE